MLDEKAHFCELQRPKEVVFHAAVGQLYNDIGQGAAMFRAVLRLFERGEDREGLRPGGEESLTTRFIRAVAGGLDGRLGGAGTISSFDDADERTNWA